MSVHASSPPSAGKAYRQLALLAEGAAANVYLSAMDGPLGGIELVAVKRLRADVPARAVALFLGWARVAARLRHPNIVEVYEVGTRYDRLFLAMEFLDGVPYARFARLR